jgi:hypothetical protein
MSRLTTRRTVLAAGATMALGGASLHRYGLAQTPEPDAGTAATPGASPQASPAAFPEGPLGLALAWLTDALNTEGGPTVAEVEAMFSPEFLANTPADAVAVTIAELGAMGGPWAIDTDTMIMTMDAPPSNASFTVREPGGMELNGAVTINHSSGLIQNFQLEAATPA